MYQALYRKYRPQSFEDVVGQEVIVKTLINAIKHEHVSHAYLFAGPRGTGKTSIAKIFAKILNCHNLDGYSPCNKCISCEQVNNNQNIDIIEIDAASNNGVDEIREIRNKITLVPSNSKYKIYIIDEVHMLTNQAFNALLKSLEEPPAHIIFIFATTEPHKIPKTILSRCQRFDFKKVSIDKICDRLKKISKIENILIDDESIYEIAKLSDGGMRDSISLLDQAASYSDEKITVDDIHDINGTINTEQLNNLIIYIMNNDLINVLNMLEELDKGGKNFVKIVQELIDRMKDCLIFNNTKDFIDNDLEFFNEIKKYNDNDKIYNIIKQLSVLLSELKNVNNSRLLLEIELIKVLSYSKTEEKINFVKETNTKEEKIIEPKINKKIDSRKQEEKVDNQEIDLDKFNKFKQQRINNSLSKFSQTERKKMKDKFAKLDDYLSDSKFGSIASLLKDGELKAISDNYIMFMYKNDLMTNLFNNDIRTIEDLLNIAFNDTYKVIAINSNDWSYIREDYNKNKDKYTFEIETINYEDLFKTENENVNNNSIDEMFNDIIEYE